MSYFRWPKYVPVAERRSRDLSKLKKLEKQGMVTEPVKIEGKTIAKTFWGKEWCKHIESFSDYDNRLPRGRTCVRNGSVFHLSIEPRLISAIVAGSGLYNIKIKVKTLLPEKWKSIKEICIGKVGSLLELLSGQLSQGVMEVVCDRTAGIFPMQKEIELSCDCPDWATMCKHVSSALYGVGARLDVEPSQLFKLRGVNHEELIDVKAAITELTSQVSKGKRLAESKLSKVFDIDLSEDVIEKKEVPKKITGSTIIKARKKLKLTPAEFANKLGVSTSTILRWESQGRKKLVLKQSSLKVVQDVML